MGLLLLSVGAGQSWSVSLGIINLCLISAIMSLGVNIQWGYAGLFNAGIMGFVAIGGVSAVLISHEPVSEAWASGGFGILISLSFIIAAYCLILLIRKNLNSIFLRKFFVLLISLLTLFIVLYFYRPAVSSIESINPAKTGFLGGLGLPIIYSWLVGGLIAGVIAYFIGKITLGLRSDYLAIATLGISEIVIAILKHEDWLSRGVKNVTGLSRPVPYEVDLQQADWFIDLVIWINSGKISSILDSSDQTIFINQLIIDSSGIFVKFCYAGLFTIVLLIILAFSNRALNSPWGRMMRAIRDNEDAASAIGKNIVKQHLQVFIIGSAVVGIAGAMLTTLDGQFTPGSYQPLRFTFIVWIMVIVGGSGNNLGSIFGGFFVWFMWIEAEPLSIFIVQFLTNGLDYDNVIRLHLIKSAPHLRLFLMGLILLLTMRFMPQGVIPETIKRE
ncbi:MAG: branched-chain amino acid ABC transporter permease [Pelagibacterales bacterium]|nr:branched-chain amino acid ABC transporter permease [Pelagibacterales bacterium]MBL6861554.1 branched-chain amino acid ABC transporter permease [Pelagibacterales bacterium]